MLREVRVARTQVFGRSRVGSNRARPSDTERENISAKSHSFKCIAPRRCRETDATARITDVLKRHEASCASPFACSVAAARAPSVLRLQREHELPSRLVVPITRLRQTRVAERLVRRVEANDVPQQRGQVAILRRSGNGTTSQSPDASSSSAFSSSHALTGVFVTRTQTHPHRSHSDSDRRRDEPFDEEAGRAHR